MRYPMLSSCSESIKKLLQLMEQTYKNGGKIMLCGNGGSCADCDHIVGELMKGFLSKRKMSMSDAKKFSGNEELANALQYGIAAVSLVSHSAVISAYANDVSPQLVYAQQVWAMGKENDLLIGISTSGNSKNVINAVITAKAMGISSAVLAGMTDCDADKYADVVVHAPETETYKVQELHLPIYHYLCAELERRAFGDTR